MPIMKLIRLVICAAPCLLKVGAQASPLTFIYTNAITADLRGFPRLEPGDLCDFPRPRKERLQPLHREIPKTRQHAWLRLLATFSPRG